MCLYAGENHDGRLAKSAESMSLQGRGQSRKKCLILKWLVAARIAPIGCTDRIRVIASGKHEPDAKCYQSVGNRVRRLTMEVDVQQHAIDGSAVALDKNQRLVYPSDWTENDCTCIFQHIANHLRDEIVIFDDEYPTADKGSSLFHVYRSIADRSDRGVKGISIRHDTPSVPNVNAVLARSVNVSACSISFLP